MRRSRFPIGRRFVKEERGQTLVLAVVMMVVVMALSVSGLETGHIYYAYRLLQASTQAAALAAGEAMPNITQAQSSAALYSSETGQENATNMLQNVAVSTNFYCSSSTTALNIACQTPASGNGSCTGVSSCNAVTVTQTAKVDLWFGGFVGIRTFNLRATSSAAMQGGTDTPFNIAVIIDTTGSMGTGTAPASDDCGGDTQIQCAVYGLQQFLLQMDPCPLNTTCSASGPYVDDVALFVFPAVAAGDATDDTVCPTRNPATVPYNFTDVSTGTSQDLNLWDAKNSTGTAVADTSYQGSYEVVTFNNTYRANDNQGTPLSTGDPLAVASGGGGGRCQGLQAPGGQATYYAQVIRQAEATLESVSGYPATGSKNIMIILSDGDANACNYQANTAADGNAGCNNNHNDIVADNCPAVNGSGTCEASPNDASNPCPPASAAPSNTSGGCYGTPLNGTGTATTNATGYQSTTYPSVLGQCGQAVEAAQYATSRGTTVYTVAMGSETSGGCSTDGKYTVSGTYTGTTYGMESWPSGAYSGQPCNAIEAMASSSTYAYNGTATFYSDATKGCTAPANTASYTTIGGIFHAIASNLSNSRLIPPGS
jgi:hypothetical protein